MKSVILGNDFLRDSDGSFKFLETNTSCALPVKNIETYFNKDVFDAFLSTNGITKIDLINPVSPVVICTDVDGFDESLTSSLRDYFLTYYSETISVQIWSADNNVIPTVEDEEDRLIIRVAYDTNALVDDTYCRDNYNFLKLMYDNDVDSIVNTYFTDGGDLSVDSIGTTIVDNGNYPNFIIKKRFPSSDYTTYPKLIKVSTQEELQSLKTNLTSNEILQQYVANTSDLLVNRFQTYRHLQFLYGGELTELDLFEPYTLSNKCEITSEIDYDDSNEVQVWERPKLIQKVSKQLQGEIHGSTTNTIFLSDGSIGTVGDLNLLDEVKSVDLYKLSDEEQSFVLYSEPKDKVLPTRISHYSVNVTEIGEPHDVNLSQKLELIDGTTYTLTFDAWSDRHRLILAGIGLSDDPWNNTSESVAITPTRSTYTLTLTATDFGEDGILCRVLFDSGDTTGEVNIDSVVLKIGEGDNLLLNGDFELGSENWIVGVDDESPAPVVVVGSHLTSASVVGKTTEQVGSFMTKLTFSNGKVYTDLYRSVILTIKDGKTHFMYMGNCDPNTEVVVGNITDDTLTTVTVTTKEFYFDIITGINIDVEEEDVFLRTLDGDTENFLVKHNKEAAACYCWYKQFSWDDCDCFNPCISDPEDCSMSMNFIGCCGSTPFCNSGSPNASGLCGNGGKE
ncbi:hypothetical protein N9H59_01725 [Flavobacteriaceae bacterium]|nr:hypothetical protein [Flavobacteriaceae bacterium]